MCADFGDLAPITENKERFATDRVSSFPLSRNRSSLPSSSQPMMTATCENSLKCRMQDTVPSLSRDHRRIDSQSPKEEPEDNAPISERPRRSDSLDRSEPTNNQPPFRRTRTCAPVTSVHYVSEWRLIACLPSTHSARVSANHASGDPQSGGGFSLNSFLLWDASTPSTKFQGFHRENTT